MSKKLIIMRGVPWSGKSYRAEELAGENGKIFSTDEYWHKMVNPENPESYDFDKKLLRQAHQWNQLRFQNAVNFSEPLIIIDNTNISASECKVYVAYAKINDYEISIEEPTSPQWQEIKPLLLNKKQNAVAIKEWAVKLAEGSKETHNVPFYAIERMLFKWQNDLTVGQIMNAQSF